MRKVSEDSKKNRISATKPKDGTNTSRRKSERQDEKKSEPETKIIRRRKREPLVEGERTFNATTLRSGDKFTFLSPGKGKKAYICTVLDSEVVFERDDKHTYKRHLSEIPEIVKTCQLVCTLI